MTTPTIQQAIEAARLLGEYFDNADLSHSQRDEEVPLHAFAQAHSESAASVSHSSANMRELSALAYLNERAEHVIWDIVSRSRGAGESWQDIADALGMNSRQAAQQRFSE